MKRLILISLCVCAALVTAPAAGQIVNFDENGIGTIDGNQLLRGFDIPPVPGVDPIPTLFYVLPFTFPVAQGDVQVIEPDNGTISDVLRFVSDSSTNTSRVYVYSDLETSGIDKDLADVGIPQPWINVVVVTEVGLEGGVNGIHWLPGLDQPGSPPAGVAPISYSFTSDVPEPATMCLLGLGALLLRRKK
jgi:hypothetical protein